MLCNHISFSSIVANFCQIIWAMGFALQIDSALQRFAQATNTLSAHEQSEFILFSNVRLQ
jgi:hypothetical protein